MTEDHGRENFIGIRSFVQLALATLTVAPLLVSSALAGPTDPVTVEPAPEDQGAIFSAGVRLGQNLPEEYVEEEFFVSGTASVYNDNNDPPLGPTDYSEIQASVAYTTRIIVRRPAAVNKVNGTVVVEWWNSTAGFDSAPSWDPSAEYFATERIEGITYVGVTHSAAASQDILERGRCNSNAPALASPTHTPHLAAQEAA